MIEMYRKVSKNINNPYGIEPIAPGENPFLKPCLLCLSAQSAHNRSVFGIVKVGASLARFRVKGRYNAGFAIDESPINFIASRLNEKQEEINEFVDTYFIPLLLRDGTRVSVTEACRLFRNINMITYCDGTLKPIRMESYLRERMAEIGYSLGEIDIIIRNISVIAIATDRVKGEEGMSLVAFKDFTDDEVLTEAERDLYESDKTSEFRELSHNVHYYYYRGTGAHDLKRYAYYDDVEALISFVITHILENSVQNSKGQYVPLDIKGIMEVLKGMVARGLSAKEILELVDDSLRYDGTPKLTQREALVMDKFDYSCDLLNRQKEELERTKREKEALDSKVRKFQDAIKRNCSDLNALRILVEAAGWQVSPEQLERIEESLTDREVIASLDQSVRMKK